MTTRKTRKSKVSKFLDDLTGGPLTLADLLNAIRIGEEMSLTEFASKLGISKSHLCDIEKGRKSVSLLRAIEFANTLGYSRDQFVRLSLQSMIEDAKLEYIVSIDAA
jgi:transcriptional regulator with XRE-family HTH domain